MTTDWKRYARKKTVEGKQLIKSDRKKQLASSRRVQFKKRYIKKATEDILLSSEEEETKTNRQRVFTIKRRTANVTHQIKNRLFKKPFVAQKPIAYQKNGSVVTIRQKRHNVAKSSKRQLGIKKRKNTSGIQKLFKKKSKQKLRQLSMKVATESIKGLVRIITALVKTMVTNIPLMIPAIVVVSVVLSISSIIPSFTIKQNEDDLTAMYTYITELDTDKTLLIKRKVEEAKRNTEDLVQVKINGQLANVNHLNIITDTDTFLSFFDVKYDKYKFDDIINGLLGGKNVKDEVNRIHDKLVHTDTQKRVETVKQTKTTIDKDGNTHKETVTVNRTITEINITIKTLSALLEEDTTLLTKTDKDRLTAQKHIGQYVAYVRFRSPFDDPQEKIRVSERFGYTPKNNQKKFLDTMTIAVSSEKSIFSGQSGTVSSVTENSVSVTEADRVLTYSGLSQVYVKQHQTVTQSDVLGIASKDFTIHYTFHQKVYNPAFYFPNIEYLQKTSYTIGGQSSGSIKGELISPPPMVTQWRELVTKYAKEQGIEDYVDTLLAIIWEETGGNPDYSPDIMQSSESIDGRIGNITNPEDSIRQGVKHFASMLSASRQYGTGELSAIQAYNYGGGFITWLANRSKTYSFDEAVSFAHEYSKGARVSYPNPLAIEKGYNWRYNYGNMFYALLVTQHLTLSSGNVNTSGQPLDNMSEVIITSPFGLARQIDLGNGQTHVDVHNGVDLVYKDGRANAPIYTMADGEVVFAQPDSAGGLGVIVKHSEDFYSYYWHLSTITVSRGEHITAGTQVGNMGATGLATGIHLHLGFSKGYWSDYFDPVPALKFE
ncbi:peptidoglycan DD-metalloendopeptidase family protein [Granulicatella sp. zg-ZJ]|uniref:lysozyme family protein n=1 Tax=Granulicatella sp. zg-ZJ TaxID=2678504 RepID=UPI0013D1E37D|nr:lysozyme family protein [Granulicatella sp. zg-ZJ]NEW62435.1 peptidoglycan DD-metalloendopeptidase family protein [Granulicatella sp. zg-ZJ]NEW62981.1 peptidoglycan DD-metalloendopeptidase family protein [Granulicatella sp. zg-ZJ]